MIRLLITVSLIVSTLGGLALRRDYPTRNGGKILGGDLANIEDFPYQAQIYDGWYYLCSGAILTENVVISAASCLQHSWIEDWLVHVGSDVSKLYGQTVGIKKTIRHILFDYYTDDYDIILIFVDRPLILDGITTSAIALPNQGDEVSDGTQVAFCGWGEPGNKEGSANLLNLTLTVISQDECIEAFSQYNWLVSERMLCATKSNVNDVGYGDIGGPLVTDNVLVGIASWGTDYYARAVCPGVWTKVSSFVDWINEHM